MYDNISVNELAELVERAKNYDRDAKNDLVELTQKKAFQYAYKLTKNEDVALDIIQDSYIKAFKSLHTLQDNSKFIGWIIKIVENKCKDYFKKRKPLLFCDIQLDGDVREFDEPECRIEYIPDKHLERMETNKIVRDIMDELPEDQRACIMMFELDDFSIAEISDTLELNQNTVKTKLRAARKKN